MSVNKVYVILNRLLWLFVSRLELVRDESSELWSKTPAAPAELWKCYPLWGTEVTEKTRVWYLDKNNSSLTFIQPRLRNNMRIKTTNEENLGAGGHPPFSRPCLRCHRKYNVASCVPGKERESQHNSEGLEGGSVTATKYYHNATLDSQQ